MMFKKKQFLLFYTLILSCCTVNTNINSVENSDTAIIKARNVLIPVYGKKVNNYNFSANLINNETWIVIGTIPGEGFGGEAHVEIQKKDGKILKMTHTK